VAACPWFSSTASSLSATSRRVHKREGGRLPSAARRPHPRDLGEVLAPERHLGSATAHERNPGAGREGGKGKREDLARGRERGGGGEGRRPGRRGGTLIERGSGKKRGGREEGRSIIDRAVCDRGCPEAIEGAAVPPKMVEEGKRLGRPGQIYLKLDTSSLSIVQDRGATTPHEEETRRRGSRPGHLQLW